LHNKRFIGIDLGTTNSSVCYTSFNTGRDQFDDPVPVRFGNENITRSLLLLDSDGQRVVACGRAVYRHPDYLRYPERVHEEFKLLLGKDPVAERYTHLLAQELLSCLERTLHTQALSPQEHVTTVGIPAEWDKNHPERAEIVVKQVRRAGFPNVKAVPEPIGAMYYHAFLGDIRFADRPQIWLVIDFGGGTTDLALVETEEAGKHPRVLQTFGRTFGGKDFDELLLKKHILVNYWTGSSPGPQEQLALLQFARRFKQKFSFRVSQGRDDHRQASRLPNVRNPVTLTREQFQSEELAGPLIDRFARILPDAFGQFGPSLSDVDRVILTGGSARWYFVREMTEGFFGRERCVMSNNPELTISKGLALAQTGFKVKSPPTEMVVHKAGPLAPVPEMEAELEAIVQESAIPSFDRDRETCRREASNAYKRYAAGGGAFALLVSPIPGLSQPFLTALEAKLVMEISEIYGYKLEKKEIATVIGGLLAGGTLLKLGVMEALTFAPGIGWGLKAGVAGGAVAGLGEVAIRYFDQRRFGSIKDGEGDDV
jgi:molecular chaperone DnaK (HSP70)